MHQSTCWAQSQFDGQNAYALPPQYSKSQQGEPGSSSALSGPSHNLPSPPPPPQAKPSTTEGYSTGCSVSLSSSHCQVPSFALIGLTPFSCGNQSDLVVAFPLSPGSFKCFLIRNMPSPFSNKKRQKLAFSHFLNLPDFQKPLVFPVTYFSFSCIQPSFPDFFGHLHGSIFESLHYGTKGK